MLFSLILQPGDAYSSYRQPALSLNPTIFTGISAALTFNSFNLVLVLLDTYTCLPLSWALSNQGNRKLANPPSCVVNQAYVRGRMSHNFPFPERMETISQSESGCTKKIPVSGDNPGKISAEPHMLGK